MTTYSSREELKNLVVTRHRLGWSNRKLAKDLHISRNTVRKILKEHRRHREEGHDLVPEKPRTPRPSKLDEHVQKIKELLEQYPNIKGQRVFEELRDAGYRGGISILREKLRQLRPRPKRGPIVRFETAPGEHYELTDIMRSRVWPSTTRRLHTSGEFVHSAHNHRNRTDAWAVFLPVSLEGAKHAGEDRPRGQPTQSK